MEVCIIGGGFSGTISAKVSLDKGLTPVILERMPSVGGLWNSGLKEWGTWNSLGGVRSKHITAFSDHFWDITENDFPTPLDNVQYLHSYIDKHKLLQYYHVNCEVTSIEKQENDYLVKWKEQGENKVKIFPYVIIASGKLSNANCPFPSLSQYKGLLLHGGSYRSPEICAGKRVFIIGKSFTGSDIAFDIVDVAESVVQIYRKPYSCAKKYLEGVPYDYFLYKIPEDNEGVDIVPNLSQAEKLNKTLWRMFGKPSEVLADWEIQEEELKKEFFTFSVQSTEYYNAVSTGKIACVKGDVVDLYENGVVLADGQRMECDVVVICMGFMSNYTFLSEEIKRITQYRQQDRLLPTVLYRSILHPDLPKMCFVGNFLTLAPGRFELQAEIGVRFMIGTLEVNNEELWQGVRDEEFIRENMRMLMWPYYFVPYLSECLRILKIDLDLWKLEKVYGARNLPILPYFLFKERAGQDEICRKACEELMKKYPCFRDELVTL